jgi:hydroxymethylglutaryl-CoA lyase
MDRVEIVEVGPRDGLQNLPHVVPVADRIAFANRLIEAGLKRIEIGSFVSPKAVPQMAGTDAVIASITRRPDVRLMGLVPNARGARDAMAAGLDELEFVLSVSDDHNRANVRRSTEESIAELALVCAEIDPERKLRMRFGLATSFHCPFAGDTDPKRTLAIIERVLRIREGVEIALADTTGKALPTQISHLAKDALTAFGHSAQFAFHGHDTSGFGIANVMAALEAGIRIFDGAAAGLGGCPFAPGASGNIATEDMVNLFERMGIATGVDLAILLDAADMAAAFPGAIPGSHARKLPRKSAA